MRMSTCGRMATRFSSDTTPTHTTTISSILSSVSPANARLRTCERFQTHSSMTGFPFALTASAHTTCTTLSRRVCAPSRCSAVHTVTRHTTAPIRSKMNESTRQPRSKRLSATANRTFTTHATCSTMNLVTTRRHVRVCQSCKSTGSASTTPAALCAVVAQRLPATSFPRCVRRGDRRKTTPAPQSSLPSITPRERGLVMHTRFIVAS